MRSLKPWLRGVVACVLLVTMAAGCKLRKGSSSQVADSGNPTSAKKEMTVSGTFSFPVRSKGGEDFGDVQMSYDISFAAADGPHGKWSAKVLNPNSAAAKKSMASPDVDEVLQVEMQRCGGCYHLSGENAQNRFKVVVVISYNKVVSIDYSGSASLISGGDVTEGKATVAAGGVAASVSSYTFRNVAKVVAPDPDPSTGNFNVDLQIFPKVGGPRTELYPEEWAALLKARPDLDTAIADLCAFPSGGKMSDMIAKSSGHEAIGLCFFHSKDDAPNATPDQLAQLRPKKLEGFQKWADAIGQFVLAPVPCDGSPSEDCHSCALFLNFAQPAQQIMNCLDKVAADKCQTGYALSVFGPHSLDKLDGSKTWAVRVRDCRFGAPE